MSDEHRAAVRARFEQRASTYDDNAMHLGLAEAVAAFVDLDGVRDVLDVATGTGLVLRALRSRALDADLVLSGVDLSPAMLDVARAALPGTALHEGDAAALTVSDDSVDLVTCVTGLHLVPDPQAVMAEWVRVLRPGGRAVTATFAPAPGGRQGHGGPAPSGYVADHASFETAEALAATAAPAGLVLRRHTTWAHADDVVLLAELTPG